MADIDSKKVSPTRTICEVHREIYDELKGIPYTENAVKLLEEAYGMAKRMSAKLVSYKPKSEQEYYRKAQHLPLNHNYLKSMENRNDI